MASGLVWRVPPSVLSRALGDYLKRLVAAVGALADYFAAKIQAYAQTFARWVDRTGNARAGLRAVVLRTSAAVVLVLFHTMSYGVYLELANQGRYAILLESLEAHYGEIIAALRRLVGGR